MSSKRKCNITGSYLPSLKNNTDKLNSDAAKEMIGSERTTRSTKRMADNISGSQDLTNEDLKSGHSQKNGKRMQIPNIPMAKQKKRKFSVEEDPISKKSYSIKNSLSTIVNETDNLFKEIYQKNDNKKRKRNSHKFWESKLTGARRVSKRLTNLKIKNKILEKIEACIDSHNALIRSKTMNRNYCKPQSTYDKLSYNKKVYSKITSSKKVTNTFTVQSKNTSTTPHNLASKKTDIGSETKLVDAIVILDKIPETNIEEDNTKIIEHSQETVAQDSKDLDHEESTERQYELRKSEVIEVHENKKVLQSIPVQSVEEECEDVQIITLDLEPDESIVCEESNKSEVSISIDTKKSSQSIKTNNLISEEMVDQENVVAVTSCEVSYKKDSVDNYNTESKSNSEEVKKESMVTNSSDSNKEHSLNIEVYKANNTRKDETHPK